MKNQLAIDHIDLEKSLNAKGFVHLRGMLTKQQCLDLQKLYSENIYRSVITMERYRFGKGEYKYFQYPLPEVIQTLRSEIYESLVPIANAWMKNLGIEKIYPVSHAEFIEECHQAGQLRPTP